MLKKSFLLVFVILMIASLLAGCTKTPPAASGNEPGTGEDTSAGETDQTEEVPTNLPASTRLGGWMDKIVFTSIDDSASAVAQLKADALDIYGYEVSEADVFDTIKDDPTLRYTNSYGSFDSILFNNSGPTFQDGRLNPFSVKRIREAMNWAIDRNYLVQEALGGMGLPKTVVLIQAYPDYALYADLIRPLEAKYAYNFEKADQVVSEEMAKLGATKGTDGKYTFNGKEIVIKGLIRSEDERLQLGNYFADQLEKLGFTVDRQIRTRNELAPIWQQGDTTLGEWHWYTGGNVYPAIVRNATNFFAEFYTSLVASTTAEEAFTPSPEFSDVCTRLYTNDYSSMEERRELFARALTLSLEDSQYVFMVAQNSFNPMKADLEVAGDLGGGISGSYMWALTARWKGQEGGTLRTASSGILTGPWNPIAGMNWVQELYVQRATQDQAAVSDPYTGLFLPQRLDHAEVIAKEGTPIQKTLDWVDLKFEPEIAVPADAWADWDAANQRFITVAEKYPQGTTAVTKVTAYYPESLWDVKWHDGSNLSVGDFVLYMIMQFDQAKVESPIYDESQISITEALLSHLKGFKIVSTDPLVIETYDDRADLDAENLVGNFLTSTWFPTTPYGPLAWHTFTPGFMAESNKELAFSASKQELLGGTVEWTHMVDGPSLEIMKKYLDQAQAENYLPYAATLSEYITTEEIESRFTNLQAWYAKYHHFWLGTGPYFIAQVNSVEGSIVAERNPDYPDLASKWSLFGEPMIAELDVRGPAQITQGTEASFDAYVTFKDAPYPNDMLNKVIYLIYDAESNVVAQGEAEVIADGQYKISLTADVTASLNAAATKMDIIAISNVVSIPTFVTEDFLVTAP